MDSTPRQVQLDWDAVRGRIRQFNKDARSPWEDLLLHELRGPGIVAGRVPALAFALNYAWRAGVQERDVARMCQHVARNAQALVSATERVVNLQLPVRDADVARVADTGESLLRIVLSDASSVYAIFAAKFIHWCEPRALPPLDSKAAKAMNRMGGQVPWPAPTAKWTVDACVASWRGTLLFYQEALSQLGREEQEELIGFDLETQPAGWKRPNTVVRLLDKYLWLEGKALP